MDLYRRVLFFDLGCRSIQLGRGPGGQDESRRLLGGDRYCGREAEAGRTNTGDDDW